MGLYFWEEKHAHTLLLSTACVRTGQSHGNERYTGQCRTIARHLVHDTVSHMNTFVDPHCPKYLASRSATTPLAGQDVHLPGALVRRRRDSDKCASERSWAAGRRGHMNLRRGRCLRTRTGSLNSAAYPPRRWADCRSRLCPSGLRDSHRAHCFFCGVYVGMVPLSWRKRLDEVA